MSLFHDLTLNALDGGELTLAPLKGKVVLVVNVASKCGLTPQYAGLETLYRKYAPQGFVVLGFPANDFAGQEPGTEQEIQDFCRTSYDVTFPLFAKIAVAGERQHPLYHALTQAQPAARGDAEGFRRRLEGFGIRPNPAPEVLWNFEKFLLGRDGQVAARFAPNVAADDPALVAALEAELAR
jgi:glutathione peroxidase